MLLVIVESKIFPFIHVPTNRKGTDRNSILRIIIPLLLLLSPPKPCNDDRQSAFFSSKKKKEIQMIIKVKNKIISAKQNYDQKKNSLMIHPSPYK